MNENRSSTFLLFHRQAVEVDGLGISLVRGSVSGNCVDDLDNRVPALFGEDMRSGCNVRYVGAM